MTIIDVSDLNVYKRSLNGLNLIYRLIRQIPNTHIKLIKQMSSSAESVPALISEGFAKRQSEKELKRFLKIALGSSDETITHARVVYLLSNHLRHIDKNLCEEVGKEYKIISKQLNAMISKWIQYDQIK